MRYGEKLDSRRFMTTGEAAQYLSISKRTLETWRRVGGGPPFSRLGRLCRYAIDDLDEWAAAGRRTSTSDPGPEPRPAAA